MITKEVSIDPPIINNLQDIQLEVGANIKHNANINDGFYNQWVKGSPHKLANYNVEGTPPFASPLKLKTY